jgi:hypothetical protein
MALKLLLRGMLPKCLGVFDPELVQMIKRAALSSEELFDLVECVAVWAIFGNCPRGASVAPARQERFEPLLGRFQLAADVGDGPGARLSHG